MSEALVCAIIEQIEAISVEEARQRVRLVPGAEEEIKRIKRNLLNIQSVHGDAVEIKELIPDLRTRLWLDSIKEVTSDIEDVLDEWSSALVKLEIDRVGKSSSVLTEKVRSSVISSFHLAPAKVVSLHDIASRIKELCEKLDDIANQIDSYGLARAELTTQIGALPSDCFYGRDGIKEEIVDCLLSDVDDQIRTISLVGMAGIGKTALAQIIYYDSRIEQHFKRIWVYVSSDFSERIVAKSVLGYLEGLHQLYTFDSLPMDEILERICTSIKGSRVLLVLDDVWTDNMQKWDFLLRLLKCGATGSRILLTTRKDTVAGMMECSNVFQLEKLSDDNCWMILSQVAYAGRSEEESKNLEDIGKKISESAKGVPLVAKTLGSLLQSRSSREEWGNFLHSQLWKFDIVAQDIFTPLLLSYYDFPPQLKQCFKYFAVFNKDFVYWRDQVIYHWVAQGFLGALRGNQDLRLKGSEYVDFFVDCSFFQDVEKESDGQLIRKWKMRDIVHDFARYLMGEKESVAYEVSSGNNLVIDLSASRPRYLTVSVKEGYCLPTSIYGAENLRSFVVTFSNEDAITSEALRIIFNQAKRLRVVDLGWSKNAIKDKVPKEIGKLVHLRFLSFARNTTLKSLPESVCDLCNLEYFDLSFCHSLEKLPDGIGKLINLKCLWTFHCRNVRPYPKSIGRLTKLRRLYGVKLRTDGNDPEEFSLSDLKDLNDLEELWIDLRGNATINQREVRRARFDDKLQLKCVQVYSSIENMSKEDVIRAFNLPARVLLQFPQ